MREKLEKIEVRTVPNGYEMKYDGTDFFYFSKMDLLAGFMAHVGAGNSNIMDKGTIMSTIFNIMLGEKYAQDVDDLKSTVARLEKKYSDRLDELKLALLGGQDGGAALNRLARDLREQRDEEAEPGLTAVLDQIDLRASVELAKAEMSRNRA